MIRVKDLVAYLIEIGETEGPPSGGDLVAALTHTDVDQSAGVGALAWISAKNAQRDPDRLGRFSGTALIGPVLADIRVVSGATYIPCARPKLAFSRAVYHFFPERMAIAWPVPRTVNPAAQIGSGVSLAAGVVIGQDVTIGDRVAIGPNTCLANTAVGNDVSIGANCSIGLAGFGYEKDEIGQYHRFPHVGRVVIGSNVEIGSNTCIDRGALGDTVIKNGAKIDNLVHIAHNVIIGENAIVIANTLIGGSTEIGDGAWLSPSVSVLNKITIGEQAVLGIGAVVIRDVDPGSVVVGNPARVLEPRG